MKNLEKFFDHTVLKPEATSMDIKKLCGEAIEYGFFAVCVNSCYVQLAYNQLKNTNVKVASVVGFPLGACDTKSKVYETQIAIKNGAQEIDMVINIGALKEQNFVYVEEDIKAIVDACKDKAILKVIIETCLLTKEEIVKVCKIAKNTGAHFVKTSTGFLGEGAKVENVMLMKETVGDALQIKASGGIRNLQTAKEMIKAGADRIGASASVSIMNELQLHKRGQTDE